MSECIYYDYSGKLISNVCEGQSVHGFERINESEPRRPAINIPSWREVMDMLVEMNMNRRKASERPSRQEKRSRSAADRQREIEEIEDRFEREDVAPRRRRRRPE